jgi:hypothetical protein
MIEGWDIVQKLVELRHDDATVDNRKLNGILQSAFHSFGISPENLLGTSNDSAAVNILAMTYLGLWARKCVPIECFAHIFNRGGQNIDDPALLVFSFIDDSSLSADS